MQVRPGVLSIRQTAVQWLSVILVLCSLSISATSDAREPPMRQIISFDSGPQEPRWVAVNDGVMGGISTGGPVLSDGMLEFRGELSLENNGGFASVRSVGRDFDLSGASALELRVKGDGRRYQLRLATDAIYRGISVSFGSEFATTAGEWTVVRVPLSGMQATVRGSQLPVARMDPAGVREIGLLIADKREGPFEIYVDWIGVE